MHVSDAKRWLKLLAEKQIHVAPLFVGPMGIGKSDIVKQVAKELNIGFVDLRLAQMEPGDLIGIPYKDGLVTKWAIPEWFPKAGTKGIIHLDEINRAPTDVRQTMFQFIWDRRMHTQKLDDGWTIVSSINPGGGDYQVEELDRAFLRRFCVLSLVPSVDGWLEYAMKEGEVLKDITGFIGTHKDMLFENEEFVMPVKRNPAGWSTISMLRKAQAIPADLEFEIVAGIVGKEAAAAFRKYLDANYERPVPGEMVLEDYAEVKAKVLKQVKKADEMGVTIKELIVCIEQTKKLTKSQKENVILFMIDLPADFKALLVDRLPSDLAATLCEDDRFTDALGPHLQELNKKK